MNINNTKHYTPSFQAKHLLKTVTNAGNKVQKVDLYSLGVADKKFGNKLLKRVDLNKLYPEEKNEKNLDTRAALITAAVNMIGRKDVVLAVRNKRPCGIMVYEPDGEGGINLMYLTKWRTKSKDDTNHMGKILMYHLFKSAKEAGAEYVSLIPTNKTSERFYESLGFVQKGDKNLMILPDFVIPSRLAQLENFFTARESINNKVVDPKKMFSLSYYETFSDKFKLLLNNLGEKYVKYFGKL